MTASTITTWATAHELPLAAGAVLVVLLGYLAVRSVRKHSVTFVDTITVLVALAATAYAGTGTLHYLDKVMHYGPDLRGFFVGVLEGAVIVSGLRARRNIIANGTVGIDGLALWVLTGLSGILSATTSKSLSEALGRLAIPAVGAWLWERLLAPARRANKVKRPVSPIKWRVRPERIAVWLRLADARDADVSAVDANRRVVRFLNATDRVGRTRRWPFSASARADRAEIRLTSHALLHYADPTAIHTKLASRSLDSALTRLGITSTSDSASQDSESTSPRLVSLPLQPITGSTQVGASLPPVVTSHANGRRKVAPASAPARRQASVTARVGVDRDSVVKAYRDSVKSGEPLSSRDLASLTGVSQSTAARVIRAESA